MEVDEVSPSDSEQLFEICLEGHVGSFIVKKEILIEQSGFFRDKLGHGFKKTRERIRPRKVTLYDDDSSAFDALFHMMQTESGLGSLRTYVRSACVANGEGRRMLAAYAVTLHAYFMADKYDMIKIRSMSVKCLETFLSEICYVVLDTDIEGPTKSERLIDWHYNIVKQQMGSYPEDLVPFFTRFMLFEAHSGEETQMDDMVVDSVLENDPLLAAMVVRELRGNCRKMQKDLRDKCRRIENAASKFRRFEYWSDHDWPDMDEEDRKFHRKASREAVEIQIKELESSASDTKRDGLLGSMLSDSE